MKDSEFMPGTQHFIFITDEAGMGSTFREVKKRVVQRSDDHVSLICFAENRDHLFAKELGIMRSHFPDRLLTYFEEGGALQPGSLPQETLESVINENTRAVLHFYITGSSYFIALVHRYLIFLGVQNSSITPQEISEPSFGKPV
jgi:ferredoxin-NADP reductase